MISFRITYIDMTTGLTLLSRTQSWPVHQAYVPGIPVRIECEVIYAA